MRHRIKNISLMVLSVAALTVGQAFAETYYDGTSYRQRSFDRGQTTQPYNEIRSELSYARYGADGNVAGPNTSKNLNAAIKAMERAVAYRDAGDMKNACRMATRALSLMDRARVDRESPFAANYVTLQAEFCSASDAA